MFNINNQNTVNREELEKQAAKSANQYAYFTGETLVEPIMFNPTQEDFDKLGVTSLRLFDNHYKQTTQENEAYTKLSLLFSYSPAELLGDDSFPDKKFGTYDIAISNADMVKHMSGNAASTGDAYEFWEVQLIDERFNTMKITINENPTGKKANWIQSFAKESCDRKNIYKIASLRYKGNFYQDLSKEERADLANEVDLQDLTAAEKKKLVRFNPNTCMIQKQGYASYVQLLLNMSALNINYFNPLTEDQKFDSKAWTKLVSGDVSALNKSYNKSSMYRYSDADGKPTTTKPKLGVFLYAKLKANGYYSQETLSPSYPGFHSSFDATFNEVKASRKHNQYYLKPLGVKDITTRMELYTLRGKLLGIRYDGTVDNTSALVKYPYSFDFDVVTKATSDSTSDSNPTQTADSSNTDADDDDTPF